MCIIVIKIENTIMTTDLLKQIIKSVMKTISLGSSHTVILKRWRRVNIEIQKFNNNANNSYEIQSKAHKMKDLIALSIL